MTKQTFEATAAIIAQVADKETRDKLAGQFANVFAQANPRFNTAKFWKACESKVRA